MPCSCQAALLFRPDKWGLACGDGPVTDYGTRKETMERKIVYIVSAKSVSELNKILCRLVGEGYVICTDIFSHFGYYGQGVKLRHGLPRLDMWPNTL